MSSSAMITLQAVREIPQISGMIADAAFEVRRHGRPGL
jgi:hypothetical protein